MAEKSNPETQSNPKISIKALKGVIPLRRTPVSIGEMNDEIVAAAVARDDRSKRR